MVGGPGVAKLAKDFKVETQKEHFPHYFDPIKETGKLDYKGKIPEYRYFEPKRTSMKDWEEMKAQFGDQWDFKEVARSYLHADCVSLHQVLVAFLQSSIPGISFAPGYYLSSLSFKEVNLRALGPPDQGP
jgi:hypothetical protein